MKASYFNRYEKNQISNSRFYYRHQGQQLEKQIRKPQSKTKNRSNTCKATTNQPSTSEKQNRPPDLNWRALQRDLLPEFQKKQNQPLVKRNKQWNNDNETTNATPTARQPLRGEGWSSLRGITPPPCRSTSLELRLNLERMKKKKGVCDG